MFFPSHYRNNFFTSKYSSELGFDPQENSERQSMSALELKYKKMERIIASTLFLDTLIDFYHATQKIETKITSRTPLWQDMSYLEDHIVELRKFRRILTMRIKIIKKELTKMRGLLN
jgi:hypothetical protein